MTDHINTVEPIFIKDTDMPSSDIAPIVVVRAVIRVVSAQSLEGVQKIGGLWRLYFNSAKSRLDLLIRKTVLINGNVVPLYEQNPYKTSQITPEDRKDKLTIKGLPMSVSNEDIKNMLLSKGIGLSTPIKFSQMRDEHGSLTRYKNGDRFVYCQPFQPSIPRQQKVGDFKCLVYHHGKNNYECRSCALTGHKAGDEQCPAKAEEDSILTFSGYQHPMSNHYLTPIVAFDQDEPFKSIEHAFFWKMALDFGQEDLAARIKKAVHAGVVKQLSKEMEETARYEWEDENTGIMKDLIIQKAKTCEEFRNCLLMNQDKVLAESTHSKRWGTGLSKWLTEQTKPNFWPGMNLLGVMMMELTEDELLSYQSQASGISPATDRIQQDSQCTTSPESDDGSQEKTQTEAMDTTHTLNTSTHSSPHESQSTQRQGRSSTRDKMK